MAERLKTSQAEPSRWQKRIKKGIIPLRHFGIKPRWRFLVLDKIKKLWYKKNTQILASEREGTGAVFI